MARHAHQWQLVQDSHGKKWPRDVEALNEVMKTIKPHDLMPRDVVLLDWVPSLAFVCHCGAQKRVKLKPIEYVE